MGWTAELRTLKQLASIFLVTGQNMVGPPCPKKLDQPDGHIAAPLGQVRLHRRDLFEVRIMLEAVLVVVGIVDGAEKPLFPP